MIRSSGAFEEKFVRASEDFFAGMLNSPVGERLKLLHLEDGLALPSGETLRVGRAGSAFAWDDYL